MKHKVGIVLGKFMPPHRGHEYLIRFAKEYAEQVYVIVDKTSFDTIDVEKRVGWLSDEIPNIKVIGLKKNTPQQPEEHSDFWNFWKVTLLNALNERRAIDGLGPCRPDVIISGMAYGKKLGEMLDCDSVLLDIERESVPISATRIREDAMKHWDFLLPSAKEHFMKKVCFVGPESTGKTTCAIRLADELKTVFVPEYAKGLIESNDGGFTESDVKKVLMAQRSTERALSRNVNRVMVCDSDALTTHLYSDLLFPNVKLDVKWSEFESAAYDLTFLFKPDRYTPFENAKHRELLSGEMDERIEMFHRFEEELMRLGRKYVVVDGDYDSRFNQTLKASMSLISNAEHKDKKRLSSNL